MHIFFCWTPLCQNSVTFICGRFLAKTPDYISLVLLKKFNWNFAPTFLHPFAKSVQNGSKLKNLNIAVRANVRQFGNIRQFCLSTVRFHVPYKSLLLIHCSTTVRPMLLKGLFCLHKVWRLHFNVITNKNDISCNTWSLTPLKIL